MVKICIRADIQSLLYVKFVQRKSLIARYQIVPLNLTRTPALSNIVNIIGRRSPQDQFEILVKPHFDALYSAARRMTLSWHDAEDLVQEVCITAYSRLDELEQFEFPRAWLLKVMYNKFIDNKRRAGRAPVDMAMTGAESHDPDRTAASAAAPDELVDTDQRVERVLRAMRCLNDDQCTLVAMHDVEGFSIKELSELTGLTAGTIKSQLHRTRVKLGRLLSNDAVVRPRLQVIGGKK